ncbi:MAG: murein L,D-transpeptidase [Frankiales bacterium]|nr:murein L,D-transpeptidase [Frankiales bacterium]
MHRRLVLSVPLALSGLVLTACTGGGPTSLTGRPAVGQAAPDPVATAVEPSSAAEAAPSLAGAGSPPASSLPSPSPARPRFTYDVAAAQRVLAAGRYYAGPIDGRSGPSLRSAVMAFQKVNGIGIDGAIGPGTLKALAAPKTPTLKGSSPADRVEVDLSKQVLYVVKAGKIVRIMPVSSGNGATYSQKDGTKATSLTPVGYYRILRRIVGERKADLGSLYDPQYFYRGWAIHGSNSVPAGPASHGCVRVTRPDAKYLLDALSNGMAVYLYGGAHTFAAGSSAPGTSNPTGDAPSGPVPASASPRPSSSPVATPSPAASSAPSPAASSPSPAASANPSPSAARR